MLSTGAGPLGAVGEAGALMLVPVVVAAPVLFAGGVPVVGFVGVPEAGVFAVAVAVPVAVVVGVPAAAVLVVVAVVCGRVCRRR